MEKVITFLSELKKDNRKEWFDKNRKRYEESRDKMLALTEIIIREIHQFDKEIPIMDPKSCLFRIFRDVRFSKDKSPYKTNMGSYIADGGRKSLKAGYYIHIEPGKSFIGGGIYMPQAAPLKAIRTAIYNDPEEFISIVEDPGFKTVYPKIYGEKLKTAPQGFPKDFKYLEYLNYKSYAFTHEVSNKIILRNDFIEYIVRNFKVLYTVTRYLNSALERFS